MGKEEVSKLSDEKLISEWNTIKVIFRAGAQKYFDEKTFNLFFASFVNVSGELHNRGIDH